MATKKMYRLLNLETGQITLYDWMLTGCVILNEIIIDYDDEVKEEHHQLILAAFDKRKEALCAELVMLDQRKQELLCITHNVQRSKQPVYNAPHVDFDDDIQF